MRDRWSTIVYRCRTRRVRGRLVTPATRVDPARFSEDEFPVYCPKCRYLLRGLPDGRCPECGTVFARGRLLLEQYVLGKGPRLSRMRRVANWCFILGLLTSFGPILAVWLTALIVPQLIEAAKSSAASGVDFIFRVYQVVFLVLVASPALLFAAAILWTIVALREGRKARQVVNAIEGSVAGRRKNEACDEEATD